MGTIFINSENNRTSECHVLMLKLTDKLDLRRGQKSITLSNFCIYFIWKNVKSSYNNKLPKFKLPDGSYSISDIQNYFEYILKKHSEKC